jgi:hypothetical protein
MFSILPVEFWSAVNVILCVICLCKPKGISITFFKYGEQKLPYNKLKKHMDDDKWPMKQCTYNCLISKKNSLCHVKMSITY